MCSDSARAFLLALPKCEHHLHIEGTLEPTMLFALAEKNGIELPQPQYSTIAALEERYRNFTSLDDFLWFFNRAMDCLRTKEDFSALAYAYLERAASEGLRHAEVSVDVQAHTARGISLETVIGGLRDGLARGERDFSLSASLHACFVKHLSVESALEMVQSLEPYVQSGAIVGLGADSTERGNPPSKFAPVYDLARSLSYPHLTIHAGEEGPSASVRSAVVDLGLSSRIDHGVRAAEDDNLLELLREKGTLLTLCPLSNVRLRVHESVAEAPVRKLLEKGVAFSLNSDDPAYFGGYILDNYLAVHAAFSLSKPEWATIARQSIDGSWCAEERKVELRGLLEGVMREWDGREI
ncbi:hypothetical protein JCM10207_001703 [Rhodosporidiobolus poonsookiae]